MNDTAAPPPLIGAGGQTQQENSVPPAKKAASAPQTQGHNLETDPPETENVDESTERLDFGGESPDSRVEPYGESILGISVGNVDDAQRPLVEVEEVPTAFTAKKEEIEMPEGGLGTWNGVPNIVTVDPYDEGKGSPFDKVEDVDSVVVDGGYVGVDPYRAVHSASRHPTGEFVGTDNES